MKKEVKQAMRKLCAGAIAAIAIATILPTTQAADVEAAPVPEAVEAQVTPRAEETVWYYRQYNGKLQKRLWSNTENKWLTDWIDC
ncbi:MAG: hypothetical protein ACI3V3_05405 [Faecousia sp.]